MLIPLTQALKDKLQQRGVENFLPVNAGITDAAVFEPPCSLKWMQVESEFRLGAFSYAVSGFFFDALIGRYTSIGEQAQVGRTSHPLHWMSTSPFFYWGEKLFDVGQGFGSGRDFDRYRPPPRWGATSTGHKPVHIGNDVYIGHGAMIMPGVRVGDGAVVGAMAVVTKDVPPYAIVAGNPATVRRLRHPEKVVEGLLKSAWWRFAPWQLAAIDTSSPEASLSELLCLVETEEPYAPEPIRLAELAAEA